VRSSRLRTIGTRLNGMPLGIHICGVKKIWSVALRARSGDSKTKSLRQNTPKVLMPNLCGTYLQDHGALTEADEDRLAWGSLTAFEGGLDSVSVEMDIYC
jgi:hypothetical protein